MTRTRRQASATLRRPTTPAEESAAAPAPAEQPRSSPLATLRRHALIIAVFVVGLGLRAYQLGSYPASHDADDEYAWTWGGMTLVQTGTPRSWSYMSGYGSVPFEQWDGHRFPMVTPYLYYPPGFPLVMGTWMTIGGYHDLHAVSLGYMRVTSLLFFLVNFWLVYLVLLRYFDRRWVSLALVFFATAPPIVFNQRLVIAENMILFEFLLAHLFLLKYDESKKRSHLAVVVAASALLPFTKLATIGLGAYLAGVALLRKNPKLAWAVAGGTALGLALFVVYGYWQDSHLFWAVQASQKDRFTGFQSLAQFLFVPKIVDTPTLYPPFALGVIAALAGLGAARSREYFLQVVLFAATMVFLVDSRHVFGWYIMPLYPALCMGLAEMVRRIIEERDVPHTLVLALFCAPYFAARLQASGWLLMGEARYLYAVIFAAAALLFLLAQRSQRPLQRWAGGALVAGQILFDIHFVLAR